MSRLYCVKNERGPWVHMLATAIGYYDGAQIVIDDAEKSKLSKGQEIVLTYVLQTDEAQSRKDRRLAFLGSGEGVIASGRSAEEIDAWIRGLRNEERFG